MCASAPILVTAYGPFPGVPVNPTVAVAQAVAAAWRESPAARPLVTAVLPVSFARMPTMLQELLSTHQPACVICLGVDTTASHLQLEALAYNEIAPNTPDVDGVTSPPTAVLSGGPPRWESPFATTEAVRVLRAAGLPIIESVDAGRYLCNAALALTCAYGAANPGCGGVFLHIPPAAVLPTERAVQAAMALAHAESWWGPRAQPLPGASPR